MATGTRAMLVSRLVPAIGVTLVVVEFLAIGFTSGAARGQPPAEQPDVRVEAALAQAESLRAAGERDRALETLRAASSLVKKTRGNDHPDLLPILDAAGQILFEQGKLPEAEVPLTRAVALREPLIEAGEERHGVPQAAALLLLGKIHAAAGRVDRMLGTMKRALAMLDAAVGPEHESTTKARDELVRAVEILSKDLGPAHEVTALANGELAEVYEALGDHAAAAATRKRQYEPQAGHLGEGHAATLAAAGAYGEALALAGRWAEGIAVVTAAAAAADKDAGCDRKALADLLRIAARLQLVVEDYSPAEAAIRRALTIDGGEQGGGADAVALDEIMLAQVAAARGDFDPAAESFTAVVGRLRERAEAAGPAVTRGLRGAADLLLESGGAETAAELFTLALKADEAREAAGAAAEDQLGLARCLLANGDASAASVLCEQALKTLRRLHGPSHPLCLLAGVQVAEAALKARQTDDAAALARRLIERKCPRLGKKEDERLARLFDGVAALLEQAGRGPDAERLRGDFIRLRARQFGDGHEYVAEAYVNFANARHAAGGHAEAVVLYRKGIELQEAALGKSHPDIASTLLPLARAHRALRQNAEAAVALRRALATWEETAGADHPVTLATVKQLALAELGLGNRQAAAPLMERLLAAYDKDPDTPVGERMRLLTRLAEVRSALGAKDVARRHLQRAVALEQQLATREPAAEAVGGLAELARVQRLLGDEDEAQVNLTAARALAGKMQDAAAQLQRIEAIAGSRQPAPPANPAPPVSPVPPVAAQPSPPAPNTPTPNRARPSDRIEAAWKELRAGRGGAARADLAAALAAEEAAGRGAETAAADLLMALADMREQPLDETAGRRRYERALAIRRAKAGADHPTTLVAALRVVAAAVAGRDPAAAAEIAAALAAPAVDAAAADLAAAREIRAAVRHAVRIAVAAGDAPTTATLLERGVRLVDPRDLPTVLQFLDHAAELESLVAGANRAAAIRDALLTAVDEAGTAAGKPEADRRGQGRLLMHRSLQARAAGDATEARARAEAALAADRAEFGAIHPATAADLLRLATLARTAGDAAAADTHLAASREATASLPEPPLAPWLDALRRLLGMLLELEQADEVVRLTRGAIDAESRAAGPRSPAIPVLLGDAARAYRLRGNTDRAMELLAEAIPLASDTAGGGSAAAVSLAVLLDRLRRPDPLASDASPVAGVPAPDLVATARRDLRARALLPAADPSAAAAAATAPLRPAPPFLPASQSPLRLRMAVERADGGDQTGVERSGGDWLQRGWERHCLGDVAGSQAAFAAAVRRAEAPAAPPAAELLEALQESALAAIDRGDVKTARGALSQLGSLVVAVRGADDPAVADVAVQLADLVLPTGDLAYVGKMLDRARSIRATRTAAGSIEAVAVALLDARLAAAAGDTTLARERLAAVRATWSGTADEAGGAADPRLVWLQLAAARLAIRLGDAAAAGDLMALARRHAVGGGARLEAALRGAETDLALRAGDLPAAERAAAALLGLAQTCPELEAAEPLALAGLARAAAAGDPAAWRGRADRAVAGLTTALDGMGPECWSRDAVVAAVDLAEVLAGKGEREQAARLGQALVRVADACLAATDEDGRRARAVAAAGQRP